VDEKQRSILLTEDGYEAAEDVLQARRPPTLRPSGRPARRRGGAGGRARARELRPRAASVRPLARGPACKRVRQPSLHGAARSRSGRREAGAAGNA